LHGRSLVSIVHGVKQIIVKLCVSMCALVFAPGGLAAEPRAPADSVALDTPASASHGLIADLQSFVQQRGIDANQLSADAMVRLMIDWYRFEPIKGLEAASGGDALVYRYGGWSEGCATAFKLSLLRRATGHDAAGAQIERFAGITLMFEPSAQAELLPFSAISADSTSLETFLQAIEKSPAFRQLAGTTPMAVLIESGGVR
jgi:hypothetical protein